MDTRMNDGEYTIRTIDLPVAVGGAITESPDGHINIYINARLSRDGQKRALKHELDHYENDDLHNDASIMEVEGRAGNHALIRASELPPNPKPKVAVKPVEDYSDWKDDIYLKLPLWE